MVHTIESIRKQADSLLGCLSHLRTLEGRRRRDQDEEDPLHISSPFLGDEPKILCSTGYRTLGYKTQVFSHPQNPLIRNRQTHVGEVVAVSVIIAAMLGLNIDLVRAAALGHDIGHVPLGHQGEAWMAKEMGKPFCHEIMGVVRAQRIERRGRGLNLTWETLDAMMRHSGNFAIPEMSQEAWIVRYADKFAYIFHDINDIGKRLNYPFSKELVDLFSEFGKDQRERTTSAIAALVVESSEMDKVSFEESELGRKFNRIRSLMYDVYPRVTQQNVQDILGPIVDWLKRLGHGDPFLLLALMTDRDVRELSNLTMKDYPAFRQTAAYEVVEHLSDIGEVDLCDPGLNW